MINLNIKYTYKHGALIDSSCTLLSCYKMPAGVCKNTFQNSCRKVNKSHTNKS